MVILLWCKFCFFFFPSKICKFYSLLWNCVRAHQSLMGSDFVEFQELQNIAASEGQVVVLECRVRGAPPLQVKWFRQGSEIQDSPDFRILQKSKQRCPFSQSKDCLLSGSRKSKKGLGVQMNWLLFSKRGDKIIYIHERLSKLKLGCQPVEPFETLMKIICSFFGRRNAYIHLNSKLGKWF